MKLSILIPTLDKRKDLLDKLVAFLKNQIASHQLESEVEILSDHNPRITTGKKRNHLLKKAKGQYVIFLDDDDWVHDDYIIELINAIDQSADVITFNGYMTTNGDKRVDFTLLLGGKYQAKKNDKGIEYYERFPNHIVCFKRNIATKYKFPDITHGEDIVWACNVNGHTFKNDQIIYNTHPSPLKKSVHIDKDMYHYRYLTNK